MKQGSVERSSSRRGEDERPNRMGGILVYAIMQQSHIQDVMGNGDSICGIHVRCMAAGAPRTRRREPVSQTRRRENPHQFMKRKATATKRPDIN